MWHETFRETDRRRPQYQLSMHARRKMSHHTSLDIRYERSISNGKLGFHTVIFKGELGFHTDLYNGKLGFHIVFPARE